MEGRLIVIERFEDESDASFAERSTFILYFRNDPVKFENAKKLSWHHVTKMFHGVTYNSEVENQLKEYREAIKPLVAAQQV